MVGNAQVGHRSRRTYQDSKIPRAPHTGQRRLNPLAIARAALGGALSSEDAARIELLIFDFDVVTATAWVTSA
jgi:hypothetical protein